MSDRRKTPGNRFHVPVIPVFGHFTRMLFHDWKDFITYPLDSTRVRSRAERLNTSAPHGAAVIPLSTVLVGNDTFECMEIDDKGHVTIWTIDKVWFLTREGVGGQIEKLRYVPRHPPKRQQVACASRTNESTDACPESLRLAFHELLYHTLLCICSSSLDSRLAFVHADHVHNIPGLLSHFKPDLLKFYWEVERPCFLHNLPTGTSAPQIFERNWATIEREYHRICKSGYA